MASISLGKNRLGDITGQVVHAGKIPAFCTTSDLACSQRRNPAGVRSETDRSGFSGYRPARISREMQVCRVVSRLYRSRLLAVPCSEPD